MDSVGLAVMTPRTIIIRLTYRFTLMALLLADRRGRYRSRDTVRGNTGAKAHDVMLKKIMPRWIEGHRNWLKPFPQAQHIITYE